MLDLGCGTGLVGAALASPVRRLVGVDVSLKMLDQAKSKALYHQLEHGELLAMTQRQPADSFDVVVAADVFIYVGKLDEVVAAVWRLLRPGGLFAFTVESMPDDTAAYQLQASGRYAHAGAYLSNLAQTLGYTEVERTSQTIRCEDRKPIPGLLFIWKKEDLPSSPPCATALPID